MSYLSVNLILVAWTKNQQQTLALPIDALALEILQDFKAVDGWNRHNWLAESQHYGTASDVAIAAALSEGWGWLVSHGLVVRDPQQTSADAYRVSRLGEQTLQHGLARLVAAERLGVEKLHPRIGQRVEQQFLLGEYEQAILIAYREVEIRVRDLAQAPNSLTTVPLMQQAFAPNKSKPGPLVDPSAEASEQVAMMEFFKGAVGLFRNPPAHRTVDYESVTVASEIVLVADLLHRLLDQVERRQ